MDQLKLAKNVIGVVDVTRTKVSGGPHNRWEYYSFKDRFHAIKTEIAVSFRLPHKIIWVSTGYKGVVSDIRIARDGFTDFLGPGQFALADLGYLGEPDKLLTPIKGPKTNEELRFNSVHHSKRQIIERLNRRIKIFEVAKIWNRRDYDLHGICISVICKITNLKLKYEPL